MEKYYYIECHTPYCGEDNDYYFSSSHDPDSKEFAEIIDYFVAENATEWWDGTPEEAYDNLLIIWMIAISLFGRLLKNNISRSR